VRYGADRGSASDRRARGRMSVALALILLSAVVLAGCASTIQLHPVQIATTTPATHAAARVVPGEPAKGLTDNPAYQWWVQPNGPQPDSWWGAEQTPDSLAQQIALMRQLGVQIFRVELVWAFVAPQQPGGATYNPALARDPNWSGYQWSRWDEIVQLATRAGLVLVPQVVYAPPWVCAATAICHPNSPPASAGYYADFMTAAVTRYRDRIHYWELWNEPDNTYHTWGGTLTQYVQLILKPGYEAVQQVDPSAQVLLGGIAGDTDLKAVYAAGARPYFDIVNFHSYYAAPQGIATALDHVRSAMREYGDTAKPIWLTEFGMPTHAAVTSDPASVTPANSNEATQAKYITGVYGIPHLQAILYYELHDTAVYNAQGIPIKWVYWGLVSHDLSYKKQGFAAYQAVPGGALPGLAARASQSTTASRGSAPLATADLPRAHVLVPATT
jgi:hypothetical protein